MSEKMKRIAFLLLILMFVPSIASAWWNPDWSHKKKITIDAPKLKTEGLSIPESSYALVRLHAGNFAFFSDI